MSSPHDPSSRLESPHTLELCSFNSSTAQEIFISYTGRYPGSPNTLLDFAKGHIDRLRLSQAVGWSDEVLLNWVGLKPSLIAVFLKKEHANVRDTQTLHFWVTDTIVVGYRNVMETLARLEAAARRKDGNLPKLTETAPAGPFTDEAATASSQPPAHSPSALFKLKDSPASLAGHQVLYKGDFRGTMVLNSAVTPKNNFLLPDGSINISVMVSGTMGDFNGWHAAYYLTPDFGVAQQYQKWAADRNKDSESWIVRFEVPDTYIDSLRREELWYGADFKRFVWISRRGQNTLMVPHLVKYDAAELMVGHTLRYPYLIDRPAERVQDDWSDKLVDDEATGEKAVQWCFDYTCAAGLRDAVRGKVHVDVFAPLATLEGPVKK